MRGHQEIGRVQRFRTSAGSREARAPHGTSIVRSRSDPGAVTADKVRRAVQAELAQRRGGQRGRVALVAHDDRPRVGVDAVELPRRGRIEPPLEHDALNHDRARQLAFVAPVGFRPRVDDPRTGRDLRGEVLRLDTVEAPPGILEHPIDGHFTHRT